MMTPDRVRVPPFSSTASPSGGTRYGSMDEERTHFEPHPKELEARLRETLEHDDQERSMSSHSGGKKGKRKEKRVWGPSRERLLRSSASVVGQARSLRTAASFALSDDDVFDSDAELSEEDSAEPGWGAADGLLGASLRRGGSRLRHSHAGRGGALPGDLDEKQWGVVKMEMMARSWGKTGLITIYAGVYLISILTSLQDNTTPTIEPYFVSYLDAHSMLGAIAIVTNIASAVGKPPMTKILDVFGRAEGVALATALYSIGYLMTAAATDASTFIVARAIAALGSQGLQLSQQIIVADTTTLSSRGLIASTISLPWLFTTWLGPPIGAWFQSKGERGDRIGYGVFGVLLPAASSVLMINLALQWRKAKQKNSRYTPPRRNDATSRQHEDAWAERKHEVKLPWGSLVKKLWVDLDVVGLVALSLGCGLVLLPLTLAARRPQSWADHETWLLITGGVLSLSFLGWYEVRIAAVPLLPPRLLRNRTIVCGSLLGLFHFCSQFCYESFFTSFLQVARFYTPRDASYIAQSYIFAASISVTIAGFAAKYTLRYKWVGIAGVLVHAVGIWLMMRVRNLDSTTLDLVLSQVVGGIGGGFTTLAAQVGCQSVVGHQDVGIATAIFLTITQIGGAVGASIAGTVWSMLLPAQLKKHLPEENHNEIPKIMASLSYTLSFAHESSVRTAINEAYIEVQKSLIIISLLMLVPAMLGACMMRNSHLERDDQGQGEGVLILGRASFVIATDELETSETSSLLANPD